MKRDSSVSEFGTITKHREEREKFMKETKKSLM